MSGGAMLLCAALTGFEPVWCGWMGEASKDLADFAKGRPAFESMLGEYNLMPEWGRDGTLVMDLDRVPPAWGPNLSTFMVNLLPRSTYNAKQFYTGVIRNDLAAYRDWLGRHPGFRYFLTLEWGNDAYHLHRRPLSLLRKKERSLTTNELERVLAKTPKPRTREEFVDRLLRPHYDRIVEWCFSDPAHLLIGESHYCIEHLAGYWGAGALGIETTRSHMFWQIPMMFCRGAARQFGKPWLWYIASYKDGWIDGNFVNASLMAEDGTYDYHGPKFGLSLSSMKRATYLTYLSGANLYERESMVNTHFLKRDPPVRLSPEGEMYERFFAFTRHHGRGVPYAPVALLVPANRGYTRAGGRAFGICDYTHADFMLDALVSTALDFPRNRRMADSEANEERVMANSRYGDVFDVLTPDFEDSSAFARAVGGYRAAILIGDYGRNQELERILREYVAGGGTLVLTSAQLVTFPADLSRAVPLANSAFRETRLGKGSVIVAKTPYLTPWYGDDRVGQEKALAETAMGEPVRYPDIEWLLDLIIARTVPISVRAQGGEAVQYGFNRTPEGWLVYLVNNGGVRKPWNEPQEIRPGGTAVSVGLANVPHGSVAEICEGSAVEVRGDEVEITIPYGDLRILEVRK